MSDFTDSAILGLLLSKIEFWTHRYEFSFQFWGAGKNTVFIERNDVEIHSIGGSESLKELLEETVAWCEKSNPRIKYSVPKIDLD